MDLTNLKFKKRVKQFSLELIKLVMEVSVRHKGMHDGLLILQDIFQELGPHFDMDYEVYFEYTIKLLRLYTLSRMSNFLGMAKFHDEILLHEINKVFGSSTSGMSTRIDPRDIAAIVQGINEKNEVTRYGSYNVNHNDRKQDI